MVFHPAGPSTAPLASHSGRGQMGWRGRQMGSHCPAAPCDRQRRDTVEIVSVTDSPGCRTSPPPLPSSTSKARRSGGPSFSTLVSCDGDRRRYRPARQGRSKQRPCGGPGRHSLFISGTRWPAAAVRTFATFASCRFRATPHWTASGWPTGRGGGGGGRPAAAPARTRRAANRKS